MGKHRVAHIDGALSVGLLPGCRTVGTDKAPVVFGMREYAEKRYGQCSAGRACWRCAGTCSGSLQAASGSQRIRWVWDAGLGTRSSAHRVRNEMHHAARSGSRRPFIASTLSAIEPNFHAALSKQARQSNLLVRLTHATSFAWSHLVAHPVGTASFSR